MKENDGAFTDKHKVDPSVSHGDKPPADPSNTNHIGKNVGQGIVSKKEGLSEQSSTWEDAQDEIDETLIDPAADNYIKNPSPEENGEG